MSTPSATPVITPESAAPAQSSNKPKPCCVCKEEKQARDDCMLFSRSDDPAKEDCKSAVEKYKACMAGFGFQV
ncbi:Cytochrome c oxidase copper chaperone [Ascosphaera apis ARSEF 7405]|uniref:Cytochrome c oxidase copper chaperone n=1 Tax=Ascosphaera apis ARSEF 7405 TaxID=392613 RepID=A0A167YRB0_9EURO|nr:Cytochrome c oxidase copper chaperone [Ascosphaera apis ARSEF 7405]